MSTKSKKLRPEEKPDPGATSALVDLEKIVKARTAELVAANKTLEAEIASRKSGEETLRLSEERFRLLVDSLTDYAVMMLDEQGRVVSWNAGAERILGYKAAEIVGRHFSSFYTPEEIAGGRAAAELKSASKLGRYVEEGWRVRKDGTRFLANITVTAIRDEAGQLRGFSKVTRDITERRHAQEQIAEQAALLDKARDAIIVRDLEGRILFWNKGAEILYGWDRREAVGQHVLDVLKIDPKVYEVLSKATLGKGEWHGELQHLTKEGNPLTVEAHTTLIRDNQGNPKSVLGINSDITEKKKIETQFIRAQRMESIGTLAGGIAHDLNNILSPIMISIEILRELSTDPQAGRILETIELSALRGADIVRQVLSFARGLEGSRVEILPRHLIKDIETIIKDTFPRKIRLEYSLPDETWTICGDPTQLHQILLNLCVNARDAIPDGGTLTLAVENAVLDEQYAAMHLQAKAGRYVTFIVSDSGQGIPPAIMEKIFEPFFTTKQLGQGTGLGLSTVMAIVKSHDGFVNVYSEPGKGTTFKVYLPAMDISSDYDIDLTKTVTLPRGNGETILLVDDEVSILAVTSQTLEAFGYRALIAHDGAEAVAIYAQSREKISGVLTDMAMPIMDGATTIRALMRINPAIKIIAASGLKANEGSNHDPHPGVKYFLSKPYTAETLLKTLHTLLHGDADGKAG